MEMQPQVEGTDEEESESLRMLHLGLGQAQILERIATGCPLSETLDALLRFLEKDTPDMLCSVLLVEGAHLRHAAAPSLPAEYCRAIDGALIGPRAGSCGTAAFRKARVIVSDIETDPLWADYRELVRPHGLRACWSTPIQGDDGNVLGTFAMYFRRVASPESFHQRITQVALHVAAIAISRDRREKELLRVMRALEARVQELTVRRRVAQQLLVDRPVGQELFEEIVQILPSGFGESAQARIAYGRWTAMSPGFSESPHGLAQSFVTSRGEGRIEIVRESSASLAPSGSFTEEQKQLVDSLVETLTVYLNRAHAEEDLAESEERYRLINQATNDAVWDWDLRRGTLWWNDGVEALFGYTRAEVAGSLAWWTERVHEQDRDRVHHSLEAVAASSGNSWREEYRFRRKDGSYAEIQDRGSVMRDASGVAIRMIGMMQDVTETKRAEERIRELAFLDPVTGLQNRAAFQKRVGEAIVEASLAGHELGFLLANLNYFRDINDSLGHQNGDRLLRGVAERIRVAIGDKGELASLGGDEFAILLPRVRDPDEILNMLGKIREALHVPVQLLDIPIKIDATLGAAVYPAHGTVAEVLWQHADVALRTAKEKYEDHRFYSAEIDHYDPARLILIGELRTAIDQGQLLLHYQPKIDLRTGRTIGAEALVRWQHPTRGLIFPDTFIPLAERTGLINPLTTAVVLGALNQGTAFMDAGLPLEMSVNLSARNLHEPGFSARLLALVTDSGFPLSRLTLEVTETAIMAEPVRAKTVLSELHEAGIHLSMDDFGVGQSSLSYLKELPITKMKIDKSFIMDFDQPKNVAVVRSAIDLARNMGLQVTAEGIETEAAYLALREFGCQLGQGYYFSRPLPVPKLLTWLEESPFGRPRNPEESGAIPLIPSLAAREAR